MGIVFTMLCWLEIATAAAAASQRQVEYGCENEIFTHFIRSIALLRSPTSLKNDRKQNNVHKKTDCRSAIGFILIIEGQANLDISTCKGLRCHRCCND